MASPMAVNRKPTPVQAARISAALARSTVEKRPFRKRRRSWKRLGVDGQLVRHDDDLHVRGQLVEPGHQRLLRREQALVLRALAQHDLGDAADPGILGDGRGGVVAVDRGQQRAVALRQGQVVVHRLGAGFVVELRVLHIQGDQLRVHRACERRRPANHVRVGGRSGNAHQYPLVFRHAPHPPSCRYSVYYTTYPIKGKIK